MQRLLRFVFFFGSFWDWATSLLGIIGIFGVISFELQYLPVYITAIIASLIIVALSLNFEEIWPSGSQYRFLRYVHGIAILFDAYTSYLGTAQHILLRETTTATASIIIDSGYVWEYTSFEQKIILLFITILVTISPMMLIRTK